MLLLDPRPDPLFMGGHLKWLEVAVIELIEVGSTHLHWLTRSLVIRDGLHRPS